MEVKDFKVYGDEKTVSAQSLMNHPSALRPIVQAALSDPLTTHHHSICDVWAVD
jgi:hypothetical protein